MSTRAKLGFLFFMSNRNGGQPEEPSVIDFELFFYYFENCCLKENANCFDFSDHNLSHFL